MRLTVAEMHSIVNCWRDEVRLARYSLPAMRRFVCRRQATGAADENRMAEGFKAIVVEVPPETAEVLLSMAVSSGASKRLSRTSDEGGQFAQPWRSCNSRDLLP